MKTLASKYDITNILVEGGGKLVGALFDLGLVDRIAVFVSFCGNFILIGFNDGYVVKANA